jgi:hypothetical protein
MEFEVNGTQYFFAFHEDTGGWLLLTPEGKGLRRIAIEDDGGPLAAAADAESLNLGEHQPLN